MDRVDSGGGVNGGLVFVASMVELEGCVVMFSKLLSGWCRGDAGGEAASVTGVKLAVVGVEGMLVSKEKVSEPDMSVAGVVFGVVVLLVVVGVVCGLIMSAAVGEVGVEGMSVEVWAMAVVIRSVAAGLVGVVVSIVLGVVAAFGS